MASPAQQDIAINGQIYVAYDSRLLLVPDLVSAVVKFVKVRFFAVGLSGEKTGVLR